MLINEFKFNCNLRFSNIKLKELLKTNYADTAVCVKLKGTMTIWPVQKQKVLHIATGNTRTQRNEHQTRSQPCFCIFYCSSILRTTLVVIN